MAIKTTDQIYEPLGGGGGGRLFNIPVAATTTLYRGTMISQLDADSMAVPTTTALSGAVKGVATHGQDNSLGAAADTRVEIHSDRAFAFTNAAAAGDAVSEATELYAPLYATDDTTVADNSAADTRPFAGYFFGLEPDGKIRTFVPSAATAGLIESGLATFASEHGVRGRSTADIPALATFTVAGVDGLTYVEDERILLMNQTAPAENGIYVVGVVAVGVAPLTRAIDADGAAEIVPGMKVNVSEGTLYNDLSYQLTTNAPITIETTALVFAEITYEFGLAAAMVDQTIAADDAGTALTVSRIDHNHNFTAAAAAQVDCDTTAAAEGAATSFSRSDHVHAIAAPGNGALVAPVITAAGPGVATTFSRADHIHQIAAPGLPVAVAIGDAQAAGAVGTFADSGHTHAVASAAPDAETIGQAQVEGVAATHARSDHLHAMPASAAPVASAIGDAQVQGAAGTFADSDHVHAREAAAAAVNTGAVNAAGAGATVAYSDHVHAEHGKSARYVMTTNVPNLAAFVLLQDGVTGAEGDLVLLANQTNADENGVYVLGVVAVTAPLTRVEWMPAGAVLRPGYTVYVEEGTLFAATAWFIYVNGEVVIDTDAHVWYPETVTFEIDIPVNTGTVTWADIPIMSATRTQFIFTNRAEVTADLTVRYGLNGAATPGPVGTCTATMIAEIAAGTVNVDDDSSMLISVLNR